jgi:hypothetical protein
VSDYLLAFWREFLEVLLEADPVNSSMGFNTEFGVD